MLRNEMISNSDKLTTIGIILGIATAAWGLMAKVFSDGKSLGGMIVASYRRKFRKKQQLCEKLDEVMKAIQELKEGQSQLQEGQAQLKADVESQILRHRAYLEFSNTPMWESDARGKAVWCNSALPEAVGRDGSFIMGDGWRSIIDDVEKEAVYQEWNDCIEQKRPFSMSYHWKHRNGKKIPIYAETHILRDKNLNITGYFGIAKLLDVQA